MKSCVTISLVEQAKGGPFVYWDDVAAACHEAGEFGFDAVELFAPSAKVIRDCGIGEELEKHHLKLAAVGTGAGWVIHQLSLSDPAAEQRGKAVAFVKEIIDAGAAHNAPAIIGSMQGKAGGRSKRDEALPRLVESLKELSEYADSKSINLIYEPLNRYETDFANTMAEGIEIVNMVGSSRLVLLADLFHMNIEEVSVAQALIDAGPHIGHVHFVDSNRRAAGMGHTNFEPIIAALRQIKYEGYLSAEAFSLPDAGTAARQTAEMFRELAG